MEFIIEALLQFFAELLLQIILEVLVELGIHSLGEPFRKHRAINPWLATIGYGIYGLLAGGFSLWLKPDLFITSPVLRIANLIATPLLAGLSMSMLGAWRKRHQRKTIRLDRFSYAFLFAFAMSLVRFYFG